MSELDDFPQLTGNGTADLERIRQWAERHSLSFTNFPADSYTDEAGVTWTRPTAYAYAMVCKANERRRVQIEQLKAAARFAKKVFEDETELNDIEASNRTYGKAPRRGTASTTHTC